MVISYNAEKEIAEDKDNRKTPCQQAGNPDPVYFQDHNCHVIAERRKKVIKMTEEQAIAIMKKANSAFNMMTEYKTGYLFWLKDGPEMIGGPNEPAAVLKKDGTIVPMAEFVMMGGTEGKELSEHPVDLK